MRAASIWIAFVAIAAVTGGTLALLNNACKNSFHGWCAPSDSYRHRASHHAASNRVGPI
jgi:hypothetical protein